MSDPLDKVPTADGLPPAFRLACACCAWPASSARDDAIRDAADGVDWARFLRVVARQRVSGLAYAALKSAGVAPPPEIEAALARSAQAVAVRALALAAEAVRLQALLEASGVPALFIKGAALAQLAYAGQSVKHCRDIDVLVAPADAERAFALLEQEGYAAVVPKGPLTEAQRRIVFRLHKDIELYKPERRLSVELHWRLMDNPVLLETVGAHSPSQQVLVLGGALSTLADAQLFAYLVTHGATHCWFRLKWLADLNAWLAGKNDHEVQGFYAAAEALGVGSCAGQALLLCELLLGYSIPAALASRLQAPQTAPDAGRGRGRDGRTGRRERTGQASVRTLPAAAAAVLARARLALPMGAMPAADRQPRRQAGLPDAARAAFPLSGAAPAVVAAPGVAAAQGGRRKALAAMRCLG